MRLTEEQLAEIRARQKRQNDEFIRRMHKSQKQHTSNNPAERIKHEVSKP